MLLVLTNSRDATADYLCERLRVADLAFSRIDTDTLFAKAKLAYARGRPRLQVESRVLDPFEVTNVWLRRPGRIGIEIDSDPALNQQISAEWAEAVEGFLAHIPIRRWMNHPSCNAGASHKLEQLSRASDYGLKIPQTILTQNPEEVLDFLFISFWADGSQAAGDRLH